MKDGKVNLGGFAAACMLVLSLCGYVAQSQITQHVQGDLGYRQPYFIFYIAHSSFMMIFPIHMLYLTTVKSAPASSYISGLRLALADHLEGSRSYDFPLRKFLRLIGLLTAGVTVPALLWYISVSLTSISDVTAILNTNAFWAYGLSVLIAGAKWQPHKLFAVVLAVVGVFVIVYGEGASSKGSSSNGTPAAIPITSKGATSKELLGDFLTLIASVGYALYQVAYKKYAALPVDGDPGATMSSGYQAIITDTEQGPSYYTPRSLLPNTHTRPRGISHTPLFTSASHDEENLEDDDKNSNPPIYPTFGLHPNFLTSCIGLCTLLFLWIPIPILHYTGIEPFVLPPNLKTWLAVIALSCCGVAYNAGFMVLLALWGPVLATVGNLLTIVLVLLSDAVFGHGLETITVHSLLGSGMIVGAFAVLVIEAVATSRSDVA